MVTTTLHASGLHSASNAEVRTQVAAWIAKHAPDYLTHTEAGSHRSALTQHDSYGVIHPRGDDGEPECAIQYRLDGPVLLSHRAVRLSSLPIPRRGGKFCYVTYAEFVDRFRLRYHIAGHMPSGVEGAGGLLDNEQGRVYLDAIEGLKRLVATLDGPCIISMDWNISLRAPWVPEFFARHFPDFTPTAVPATEPGTHGSRLIDFSLVRGYTSTGDVIANPTSDHRAIRETVKETAVTNAQIFPGADRTSQWFADNFPGSKFVANCGVLHSTEGTNWPGYSGGASAPTLTAKPDFARKRLVWRQHFPIDMSSRALRNLSGGVETNTLGVVQVELIGTTDPKHRKSWNGAGKLIAGRDYIYWPEAEDWALAGVADFLRWCNTEHGIKLQGPSLWLPYPESFGPTRARMTFDQWRGFFGWCAHQHVPENTHGDVKLDFARILELATPSLAINPEGDDVSWSERFNKWYPGDPNTDNVATARQQLVQARGYAQVAYQQARQANARAARIEAAIVALASGLDEQVQAAVTEALADAVVNVDVTVNDGTS